MNEQAEPRRTTDASEVIMFPRRSGATLFFSAEARERFQSEGRWWSADPAAARARPAAARPGDPIIFPVPPAGEIPTPTPVPTERPDGEAEPTAIRATLNWCAAYGWDKDEYSPTDALDVWVEAAEEAGLDVDVVEDEWLDGPAVAIVRVAGRLYLLLVGELRPEGSRDVEAEPFTPMSAPECGGNDWHRGAEQPQLIIGRPGMGKASTAAWLAAETIARGGVVLDPTAENTEG